MSFTGQTFWVFFIIVLTLYWLVRESRWQNLFLLAASYVFYGWIQPWLAIMLGVSTLIDFFLAKGMRSGDIPSPRRTRSLMVLSLVLNLGVLGFFKYYNFFNDDLARVAGVMGIQADFLLTRILLPAGLSFYTLKKLGYMIDVSKGTLQPNHSLIDFALYVSFF